MEVVVEADLEEVVEVSVVEVAEGSEEAREVDLAVVTEVHLEAAALGTKVEEVSAMIEGHPNRAILEDLQEAAVVSINVK